MLPRELIKKIRHIQIRTSHTVNDVMAGAYESVFKGQGIEFDEIRPYTVGDEVKNIDWNVTARMNEPFIKKFVEEREMTVMLLIDLSASGNFGSKEKSKKEIAAELAAILAFSAIKNNDKVGLIIFTDKIEHFVPPKKGKRHVLRLIREVLYFQPENKKTDITCALQYLNKVTTRKTVTFLISDFLTHGHEKALKIVSRKHDLIAVNIFDPREKELPKIGIIEIHDAETGKQMLINTNSETTRESFKKTQQEREDNLKKFFRLIKVDQIEIDTSKDYTDPLVKFFKNRKKRNNTLR